MDTLIVQYGIKHGRAAELVRSCNDKLSIGRSYNNDLVLTDAHIAPKQMQFCKNDGQWQVSVLDYTNPVLLNGVSVGDKPVAINSGDKITVGRTHLSLYSEDHPVTQTRKLILSSWLHRDSQGVLQPFLFLLLVCILDGLLEFFQLSTDLKWKEIASSGIVGGIIIIIWAGLWSLTGKLLRHQQHFGLQLIATSMAMALLTLFYPVSSYLEYITHSTMVGMATGYGLAFVTLVILLKLNLYIATNIDHTFKVSIILSSVLIGVVYWLANFNQQEDFSYSPQYSTVLRPPFAQVLRGKTVDEYFDELKSGLLTEDQ